MTQLLEEALARVAQLPEEAQDAIAAIIMQELEDEERWESSFRSSQSKLSALVAKVREDIRAGRVEEI